MTNNQLQSIINRAVNLENQRKDVADDLKELYLEAKGNGFDPAALKVLVKEQLEDASKRSKRLSRDELIELYRVQLGPLDGTPLGNAAIEAVS